MAEEKNRDLKKDSRSLQKRGFTSKQLKKNRPLRKNGKFPNPDSGQQNNKNDSEKR